MIEQNKCFCVYTDSVKAVNILRKGILMEASCKRN